MSLTMTVPAVVPSVFQSSSPELLVLAWKKRVSPTTVRSSGSPSSEPAQMSLRHRVPAAVPSLTKISVPTTGSRWARKNRRPL